MSLAVFDISKVVENGVEITPEIDPSSGTIRYVTLVIVCGVVWTLALSAIPSLSSAPSSPAPQRPLRLSRKMLSSLGRCLGRGTVVALGGDSHDIASYFVSCTRRMCKSVVSVSYIYDILLHLVGILYHVRMILP